MRRNDGDRRVAEPRQRVGWIVVVAMLVVVAPAFGGAVAAATSPTIGFAPRWAVGTPAMPADGRAFAVDDRGAIYVTDPNALLSRRHRDGTDAGAIERSGTGTLDVRAIDTLGHDVVLAASLSGVVVLDGSGGPVTLDDADGDLVLLRLDSLGAVTWTRVIGTDGNVEVGDVFASPSTIVLTGLVTDEVDIEGYQVTPGSDRYATLVVGFEPDSGATRWLSSVETADTELTAERYAVGLDGNLDGSTFALVALVQAPAVVHSSSAPTSNFECRDDAVPDTCFALISIDTAFGVPTLERRLGDDHTVVTGVAVTDDGYAVLGASDHWSDGLPTEGFVRSLDASGDERWSRPLVGFHTYRELEVDRRGDLVVADTFDAEASVGSDADAVLLDPTGAVDAAVIELDPDGAVVRVTRAGGPGATIELGRRDEEQAATSLRIGPDGEVLLRGAHDAAVTIGSGPRAATVGGDGMFLASFPPDLPPDEGSTFHATAPVRLLDSRTPTGGWGVPLQAGAPRTLVVAGVAGVPADASAVVLNVTLTDVSAMTFVTAWPAGSPRPTASNLNSVAGDTISNHVTVEVGEAGAVAFATAQGTTHVVADLLGYYTQDDSGSVFHAGTPERLLDSRLSTGGWNGALVAGAPRPLTVAGAGSIPSSATAVVLSVTVTDTSDMTYLRVQPAGSVAANSNIAVNRGQTITNLVTTAVGPGGQVTFTNNTGTVNVVADAVGYYDGDVANGSRFHPVSPTRLLDSRTGNGGPAGPWGAGETRAIDLDGRVPTGAAVTAIATNLTATDTTAMSYLTLYPMAPRPATSNLLFTAGQTIAAAATTGVGPDGTVSLFNQLGSANLVLDLDGYFTTP